MTQKRRSPRKAGHGHKLAGWVYRHSTLLEWLPVAVVVAVLLWLGAVQ